MSSDRLFVIAADQYEGLDDGRYEVRHCLTFVYSSIPALADDRVAYWLRSDAIKGADVMLYAVSMSCEYQCALLY